MPMNPTPGGMPAMPPSAGTNGAPRTSPDVVSYIRSGIDALPPEERQLLRTMITPEIATVLAKVIGTDAANLLDRDPNEGGPVNSAAGPVNNVSRQPTTALASIGAY